MEHPILFSAPMVQAILDGRKTMTRRVLNPQPSVGAYLHHDEKDGIAFANPCSFNKYKYQVGDRLWVREAWAEGMNVPVPAIYKADKEWTDIKIKWKPSIFMHRWASRITLEITNIRVERLQDITEADAWKEGVHDFIDPKHPYIDKWGGTPAVGAFSNLWQKINGKKYPWSSNPWVWVVEFKKLNMAA